MRERFRSIWVRNAKSLPGLMDAGAASAATFVAGVVAARVLPVDELGAYALIFSLALLAATIPQQLIGVPIRARLIHIPASERVGALSRSLWLAAPFSALGAGLVILATYAIPEMEATARVALAVTGALYAAAAPLGEHTRAMFHLGSHHWSAGALSVLRLLATGLFLSIGVALRFPSAVLPLGSLALADCLMLAAALTVARRDLKPDRFVHAGLARSGVWLLAAAAMAPAAGFVVNLLVVRLADTGVLGIAEGARIVAQPVLVLAVGLASVAGPASMEAAHALDGSRSRSIRRSFNMALIAGATGMALVSILPRSINPMLRLVPVAFEVRGLVLLSIVAAGLNGAAQLERSELVVAARMSAIGRAEAVASISRVVVGMSAGITRVWAVPLSLFVTGAARKVLLHRDAVKIYEQK